jgi:plastocyanin
MRKIATVLLALIATSAFAHSDAEHVEHLRMMLHAMSQHGAVIPQPDSLIEPTVAVPITIQAKCFQFTPSNFSVHQGDVVTITLTAANESRSASCEGIGHGLLMETYVEQGVNVAPGQSRTITFTATTVGQFTFICNQSSCGSGHSSMLGSMIVLPVGNPAPIIQTITPNSGPPTGGTVVTIAGNNFTAGATVNFGTVPATNVTVVNSTTIQATSPAHSEAAVDVAVVNPDGQTFTMPSAFTFIGMHVVSVSPNSGSTSGGTNVTISGSAFQSGATVTFGARPATNVNVVDSTKIVATTPLGPASEQLQVDIVVTNPDGTSATLHPGFNYSLPPLQVTSVSPPVAVPGGGTVVTITGAGFTNAVSSRVTFGGVPATNVTILDPVTMQATAPPHAEGPADVSVTMGGLTVVKSGAVTYKNPPPRGRAVKH